MHRWDLEKRCDTPFRDIGIINWKYKGKKCTRDEINYILEGHAMRHLEIPSDVAWAIVCFWKGHEYSHDPSSMVWYWWNKGYNEYKERKDW